MLPWQINLLAPEPIIHGMLQLPRPASWPLHPLSYLPCSHGKSTSMACFNLPGVLHDPDLNLTSTPVALT
eukprot:469721-Pelagomonas_calceolata.AAC.6